VNLYNQFLREEKIKESELKYGGSILEVDDNLESNSNNLHENYEETNNSLLMLIPPPSTSGGENTFSSGALEDMGVSNKYI